MGSVDGDPARAGADARLEVTGHQTCSCAHAAFRDRPALGLLDGAIDVLGTHVSAHDIVALGHNGNDDVVFRANAGKATSHPLDGGIRNLAHGHGAGEQDGGFQKPPLHHLGETRNLAGTVEHESASQNPLVENGIRRQDSGHTCAHRPLAHHQRPLAQDQSGVAHAYAGHVGNGIERSCGQMPDGKSELTQALSHWLPVLISGTESGQS